MADNNDFSGLRGARLKERILAYLNNKWLLVPVDRDTRKRARPDGEAQTTRDINKAMEWNDADFGLAVATGQVSGIVALRYRDELGKSTLDALLAGREPLVTLRASLLNIGNILLFRAPKQKLDTKIGLAPGLDLLAEKAYFSPVIWEAECTELADLPDFLLSLATGQTTFSYSDLAASGNLEVFNYLTKAEAARAYHELGLEIFAVDNEGKRLTEEGTFASPEFWQVNPEMGIAIVTGSTSGVVGLWTQDERYSGITEKLGSLPLPQIRGRQTVACFCAPLECFPSKVLFYDIKYLGEDDFLPLPPSVVNGSRLRWQVANDVSPELPEIMPKLRKLLTDPEALAAAQPKAQPQPQPQQPSQSIDSGPAALRYAAEGWAVFPLWPGGKTPITKNGLKAATFEREQINKWWKKKKCANVAVRTGVISGIVVLDVDTKKGQPGLRSLSELEAQHGRMDTLRAHTPTGGLHLFFRAPMQKLQRKIGFLPGLDFLAEDSYVVVAPSRVGGKQYRWENPTATIAELPKFLLTLVSAKISNKTQKPAAKPHETLKYGEALVGVQEGTRNDTIFRLACKLRMEGWDYDVAQALVRTASANCQPPFPDDEALRCLDSAWRYEPPLALSDMGNAERFVSRYGDRVRYIPENDRWLVWAGHWWQTKKGELYRMAKNTVRSLRDEAAVETDPSRKRLLYAHGRKSETPEALERMLQLAGMELAVSADDLDRPGLVAFANGVLDQRTGTLRPGLREDLLTKHAKFPYVPDNPECRRLLEPPEPPADRRSASRTTAPATPTATHSAQVWQEKFDQWLAERCEVGPTFSEKAQALRDDISAWAGMPVTDQRFGRLIRQKSFAATKSNSFMYHGLRLHR